MKISLIGATGFVGEAILQELLERNHNVVAIARNPNDAKKHHKLKWSKADVNDVDVLSKIIAGSDVVISAYNAGWSNPNLYHDFKSGSKAIQEAVKKSGVKRLIVIGGAGSLYVAPGVQAVDTPAFPKEYHAGATAARDYLNILKEEKNSGLGFCESCN